jgi:hypothetical protein
VQRQDLQSRAELARLKSRLTRRAVSTAPYAGDVSDLDPVHLLHDADPQGTYLLELIGAWRVLWRVTEGEPPAEAFEPAELIPAN